MKHLQKVKLRFPFTFHLSPFTCALMMLLFLSTAASAQIKISALPTMSGTNPDSVWVPIVQGADTKKARGYLFSASKLTITDTTGKWVGSVERKTDSIIIYKGSTRTAYYVPSSAGSGSTNIDHLLDTITRLNDSTIRVRKNDGSTFDVTSAVQKTTKLKWPLYARPAIETGGLYDSAALAYADSVFIGAHLTGTNIVFEKIDGDSLVLALPSGGGTGSGISQLGSPAYGLIRVNDSTYIGDTSLLASKPYVDAKNGLKVNISDTAAMLAPYYNNVAGVTGGFRLYNDNSGKTDTILVGGGTDTSSLSDRINLKLNISDTTAMLFPYLRSALAASTYLDKTASQTAYHIFGNHTGGSAAPTFGKINVNSIDATGTPSGSTVLFGNGTWGTTASSQWVTTGSDIYYNTGKVGIGATTPTSRLSILDNAIGAVANDTSGIYLGNQTAATAGNQKYSPSIVWEGQGWKTIATAGSQSVKYRIWAQPVQGSTSPTVNLVIQTSVNGAAYTSVATFDNGGSFYPSGPIVGTNRISGRDIVVNSANAIGQGIEINHVTNTGSSMDYLKVKGEGKTQLHFL